MQEARTHAREVKFPEWDIVFPRLKIARKHTKRPSESSQAHILLCKPCAQKGTGCQIVFGCSVCCFVSLSPCFVFFLALCTVSVFRFLRCFVSFGITRSSFSNWYLKKEKNEQYEKKNETDRKQIKQTKHNNKRTQNANCFIVVIGRSHILDMFEF